MMGGYSAPSQSPLLYLTPPPVPACTECYDGPARGASWHQKAVLGVHPNAVAVDADEEVEEEADEDVAACRPPGGAPSTNGRDRASRWRGVEGELGSKVERDGSGRNIYYRGERGPLGVERFEW